ncbi:MAG: MFS transporter [Candidatus Lokiarchaeota archaeon]|nr:MFS transporter [Candidatus Lokiarchaeota archaeon]
MAEETANKKENDSKIASELYPPLKKRKKVLFGFGAFTDQMSHQAFLFLIFTYYYSVIGVSATALMWAFLVFAIWDSINDPLIGPISDRTKTRWGRRRFWLIVVLVPFALIHIFLFTISISVSDAKKIAYMIITIMLYDLTYTVFSANQLSLFPEMFKTIEQRAEGNMYKNLLTILGVIIGNVIPTLIITPMSPSPGASEETIKNIQGMYLQVGVLLAVFVVIFGTIFILFGIQEDPESLTKPDEMPSIKESLKITLKNKAFIIFVVGNLFIWYVFKLLTTIIPLYGINVLGIDKEADSFLLTLLLFAAFLSAFLFFPVMRKLGLKYGARKALMISCTIWIVSVIPFAFLDDRPYIAIPCMAIVGIGLSGAMYFVDIIIASVIDEDEVKTGKRRAGAFYGINALINRYSTILVFVVISSVLSGYGWDKYLTNSTLETESLIAGLKILMVVCTISGILIVLLCLKFFPIHGKRLKDVQKKLENVNRDS